VTLLSGKVLLIGGQTAAGIDTATVDIFDPATSSITAAAPMSTPRSGHSAVLLPNGKVLVAGGTKIPNNQALASAELYDPGTNTWAAAASMTQAREHGAATLMPNGRVFVAGGDGGGYSDPTGYEVYDPATNTWTGVQAEYGDRPFGPALAVLHDGRILIYGGALTIQPGNQYEIYDPANAQPGYGKTIPDTYDFTTAAVLPDGSVLLVGGQAGYNPAGPLSTTYRFTPVPEGFTFGPAMNVGHCHHTMTTLKSGGLLVVGGGFCSGAQPNGVAETFDPTNGKWYPAGVIQNARGFHSAVLLADGRVLVAGGFVAGQAPTATVEIYTPA